MAGFKENRRPETGKKKIVSAEHQVSYIKAQQAISNLRDGHPEGFAFVRQFVTEDPFDDKGLGLSEHDYVRMKAEYEKWKATLPSDIE